MNTVPSRLKKYCKSLDDELIIKKPISSDHMIMVVVLSIAYVVFFYLFRDAGQGAFLSYLAVTSVIIFIGIIYMIRHYSPYKTQINFITGNVKMKGILFQKNRSFLLSSDDFEPVSLTYDYLIINKIRYKYSNVDLVISKDITIEPREYRIMRFENKFNQEVHPEAKFLYNLLSQGFSEKLSASDLLKKYT